MQIIELDLDHDNLFCPASGARITGPGLYNASPAQKGVFFYEFPEEAQIEDESLQKAWDKFTKKTDDYGIEDFLDTVDEPNWVGLKVTTHGMACGPVSFTCLYVIDMNWEEDNIA